MNRPKIPNILNKLRPFGRRSASVHPVSGVKAKIDLLLETTLDLARAGFCLKTRITEC